MPNMNLFVQNKNWFSPNKLNMNKPGRNINRFIQNMNHRAGNKDPPALDITFQTDYCQIVVVNIVAGGTKGPPAFFFSWSIKTVDFLKVDCSKRSIF